MEITRGKEFKSDKAWGAKDIANMNGITTRLHWTDKAYKWHVNDDQEVFVVLDGVVEMFYKENGIEQSCILNSGDIFLCVYWHRACCPPKRRSKNIGC